MKVIILTATSLDEAQNFCKKSLVEQDEEVVEGSTTGDLAVKITYGEKDTDLFYKRTSKFSHEI